MGRAIAAAAVLLLFALGWLLLGRDAAAPAPPPPPRSEVPEAQPPMRSDAPSTSSEGPADPIPGSESGEVALPETAAASREGIAIEVIVLDADSGAPIPGASVCVTDGGTVDGLSMPFTGTLFLISLRNHFAGEDGTFRFEGLPPGEILTVRASAAGRAAATESLRLEAGAPTPGSLTLRLAPAGTLYGVVLHPDGSPAAGADVYAIPADHAYLVDMTDDIRSGDWGTGTWAKTVSGEDGSWRLEELELDASWILFSILPGFGRSEPLADRVCTRARPELACDLVLRKDGVLRVRVRQPDGSPLAGAPVMVDRGVLSPKHVESDADGLASFAITSSGTWEVQATPTGLLPLHRKVDVQAFVDLDLELQLSHGVLLAGVLVDDLGQPIPYQTLVVIRHGSDEGLEPSEGRATTDAIGRFRLEGMGEGPHQVILIGKTGHAPDDAYRVFAPDENARIVAPREARLRAILVPPEGHALPADAVSIEVRVDRVIEEDTCGSNVHATLENGALRAGPFPSDACLVRILVFGFLPVERNIVAAPGAEVDLGSLPLDPGVEIAGRVADASGRPIAGAKVWTSISNRSMQMSAKTALDGTFLLRHQPRHPVRIEIEAEEFLSWTGTAVAGARVEAVLLRGAVLRGVILKPDGTPAADRIVQVIENFPVDDEGVMYETLGTTTDAKGHWSIRVQAGRYELRSFRKEEAADHIPTVMSELPSIKVDVHEGEIIEITLE